MGISKFHESVYSVTLGTVNNYSITQTDSNGCMSSTENLQIIPQSGATPAPIIHYGLNFIGAPSGVHRQWYLDGVPAPNSNFTPFEMTETGCYRVFYWWANSFDCGAFSTDSICVNITDLKEAVIREEIIVYPNPTAELLTISGIGLREYPFNITIENLEGQTLLNQHFGSNGNGGLVQIRLSQLAAGMYFLKIHQRKQQLVTNVINCECDFTNIYLAKTVLMSNFLEK